MNKAYSHYIKEILSWNLNSLNIILKNYIISKRLFLLICVHLYTVCIQAEQIRGQIFSVNPN